MAAKKKVKTFGYKTYNFSDKDPIIDKLRTLCENDGRHWEEIAFAAGVGYSTLCNWFQGSTRRPQFATVIAVARAVGADFELVAPKKKNISLVKGA